MKVLCCGMKKIIVFVRLQYGIIILYVSCKQIDGIIMFYVLLYMILFNHAYSEGSQISSNIPSHLIPCYRNGGPEIKAPKTLRFLIEIINKLEKYEPNLSIRLMSYSIIKSFRMDGIERAPNIKESEFVTPFGASAFQFHKYKLLMDSLIPGENLLRVEDILSKYEICAMHNMLSSTVNRFERGDEKFVCPLNMESRINVMSSTNSSRVVVPVNSRCPIEEGAVLSTWGTIAPGIVITTIAAAFEIQNVPIGEIFTSPNFLEILKSNNVIYETQRAILESGNEEFASIIQSTERIINIWATSISGDLAEVLIRQGPFVDSARPFRLGPSGRWNDTLLPRKLYLFTDKNNNNWEFTDAEILGGIDALIISNYASNWTSFTSRIRLSQVLELYYSGAGLLEDNNVKVCNRKINFKRIFNQDTLYNQTLNFAKLLSATQSTPYIEPARLKVLCRDAVTKFTDYYSRLLDNFGTCIETLHKNHMEIIVITDGTWDRYGVEVLLLAIIEIADVSVHGSKLGLLQGNTGDWIVRPTHSIAEIYESIQNYTLEWPNRLDLPIVLTSLVAVLENRTHSGSFTFAAMPTIVLIAAPTTRISKNDFERAMTIMGTLRQNYHDVYFVHMLSDNTDYTKIALDPLEYSDIFISSTGPNLENNMQLFRNVLRDNIFPKKIIPVCAENLIKSNIQPFDDFILPGQKNVYRIHPYYFRYQKIIKVKFTGTGTGDLTICSHKYLTGQLTNCTALDGDNMIEFVFDQPCRGVFCHPIYFSVMTRRPTKHCADSCRLPIQTRYRLSHDGLSCYWAIGRASTSMTQLFKFILAIKLFLNLINKFIY